MKSNFGIILDKGIRIDKNYFPGFVRKALSFSIADGIVEYDKRLIEIVKPAGILGTFNLINTSLNRSGLTDKEYIELYSGFEVSNHHVFHPLPWFDFDGFCAEDFSKIQIHDSILYDDSIKNELDSSYLYKTDVPGLYFIDYNYHFYKIYTSKYWHPIMTNDAYIKYAEETKKDIDYLVSEVISNCYTCLYFHPEKGRAEIFSIIEDAVDLRNELIDKATNPAEPKNRSLVRKHYLALRNDMFTKIDELFERLSAACK